MESEFITGKVRFVEHMAFLEVISFWGEGVGAALYILGAIYESMIVMLLGIAFVIVAMVALMAHLGKRAHLAWRAITKIKTSWVSRGSLFIGLFLIFSVISLVASFTPEMGALQYPLKVTTCVLAGLVIIYAGMMLRSMKAVTIWHTYHLPVAFSLHSITTALVIFLAVVESIGIGQITGSFFIKAATLGLLLSFVVSIIYLAQIKHTTGVLASLDRLLRGMLRVTFLWGAGFVGIVVPLAALSVLWFLDDNLGHSMTVLISLFATGCRLYGDYAFRYSIVKSGAYEPVVPPSPPVSG